MLWICVSKIQILTITLHGNSHVNIQLQLGSKVSIRSKPELVAREEEVVNLRVEEHHHQAESDDGY